MININLIEQLRKQHGYSQAQMGEFLGYESHTAYGRKVRGTRDFSIDDVIKLCKLFSLTPNELIVLN